MGRKRSEILEFDADKVRPLPGQPRKRFAGIAELAASISEIGQSCPGIVTLITDDADRGAEGYEAQLVDGERRLRACKRAGVPFRAEVRDPAALEELFVASFAANFGKQSHDAMEIAEALDRMRRAGKSGEQMARIAGKSVAWVTQHLSLLKLEPAVQQLMVEGRPGRGGGGGGGRRPRYDGTPEDAAAYEAAAGDGAGDGASRLTYSLALLLAPLPAARQVPLARRMVRKGTGLTEARRLVMRERAKDDPDVYVERARRQGLKCHQGGLAGLEKMIDSFRHRVGFFLDMPGAQINELIDVLDGRTARAVAAVLEGLADDLAGLGQAIAERRAEKAAA